MATRSSNRKGALIPGMILLSLIVPFRGQERTRFPLKVSESRRHFSDAEGNPFLILGDTAWSLIAQLTEEEAGFYLSRRKAQGFNATLVNLLESWFSAAPPANATGDAPFAPGGSFTRPNELYFAHADAVIDLAGRRGMLVFLVPAYLGWKGGDEGWMKAIRSAGPASLREYGRFVGRRYGNRSHVVWVVGGDHTPPKALRWTVDALAEGIREGGAAQLMTAHCGQESPAGVFGGRPWLDFNNIYSYEAGLHRVAFEEYGRKPVKPFILIEGRYEGEHDSVPEIIRSQAYGSLLMGAAGHFFGNNPVWNFDAPIKVFPSALNWKAALDSPGARDIGILRELFRSLRWSDLQPDETNRFVSAGRTVRPAKPGPITAASPDGSLVLAYVTRGKSIAVAVNLDLLAGHESAFWFDPTSGERTSLPPSLFFGKGWMEISVPRNNAGGDEDWVLVLESAAAEGNEPGIRKHAP